jgi:hypothetical protein
MKKVLILGLLLSLALTGFSQVNVGFKGGLNFTKFNSDLLETNDYILTTFDGRKTGYHIGIFGRIDLFGLFVQPEMIYTVIRSETAVFNKASQTDLEPAQVQISRLDIPALVGAKLGPVRLGAGPVASFNLTNRSELEDLTRYIANIKTFGIGYQAGAGINLLSFTIDLRYEGSLSKLGDSIRIGSQDVTFDRRTNQIILSFGLTF